MTGFGAAAAARLGAGNSGRMGLVSGSLVDLNAPYWLDMNLDDLALGLARIPRFLGQTKRGWSIAEHSKLVMTMLPDGAPPRTRLAALTHDAHEALIGDLVTPFVCALDRRLLGAKAAIAAMKADCDRAIARAIVARFGAGRFGAGRFGAHAALALAEAMRRDAVKAADELALIREWEALVQGLPDSRIVRVNRTARGRAEAWLAAVDAAARSWLEGA